MSATEDRTFSDVADRLAAWQAAQDATASRSYPPLSNSTTSAMMLAEIAIEREAGIEIEQGSPIYEALAYLARNAFNAGHDLTRNVERGVKAGQRWEVEAAMNAANGKASEAMDTYMGLIREATAIKFTEPREFGRIMKRLRHAIWRYADATARHHHFYHCLFHPGDPLRWHDYDADKEAAECRRQRKAAAKDTRR